ncbi:transglutaminase domain-containing protein [Flavobacterium sp. KACC 22761]|uniref:transglutaminase domain-containing protein n=1 Tax=Flavobacterium sp. KACC 22761 TaxID=3092665 RepID=UPI002A74B7F4|nr:transglutaminase domain-containing protein [Flavobacterium sp. KACC 22761]WPO80671.1 transglutaminase domain-containing protein [Flavobacterium sp. KACC 22761]
MIKNLQFLFPLLFLVYFSGTAQSTKPKSYIAEKKDSYEITVKNNLPSIILASAEKKWIGDKDDKSILGNRISYIDSFERVFDIEAYSISPANKKQKIGFIGTGDREIDEVFVHDMKFKYYNFLNLEEGSQTYSFYKKEFKKPQYLESYYFKDYLECKSSKIVLKVSKDVEIGYTIQGNANNENIEFHEETDGDFTVYSWQMLNTEKEEKESDSPTFSYFSPHLIFYIKNYKNASGTHNVVGNIENLYRFYAQTIKEINKEDQTTVKEKTAELITGLTKDADKAKAIFDFVQTKVNYVAFEDGMGGFIPRDASAVLQKKYGDCKDMANLLNEMLHYAGIESSIAWIGTRHNNYTYENVPSPIVDNHMITVAKIDNKELFLDATGHYSLFPNATPFIQGKEALIKIDDEKYKIIKVPVVSSDQNKTNGKFKIKLESDVLIGQTNLDLSGYLKTQFISVYKTSTDKSEMLRNYFSYFIQNIKTSNVEIKNDDLSQNPLEIQYQFELNKWIKKSDNQLLFKPILFFPYSNARINIEKRKTPLENDFKKSYDFEYDFTIPDGYIVDYMPENFTFSNDFFTATITYKKVNNTIIINQKMAMNALLVEKANFETWNTAIKNITKQYNQNIILVKK